MLLQFVLARRFGKAFCDLFPVCQHAAESKGGFDSLGILNGRASVTAAMALRFSDAFGGRPELWLDLQQQHDLRRASRRKRPKIAAFPRAA